MNLLSKLLNKDKEEKEKMDNITSPIFLKEFKECTDVLAYLYNLREDNRDKNTDLINRDIKNIRYGLEGEKATAFEIKNSFLPLLALHDIRLEYKSSLVAQFDFIILTTKGIIVIEVKNLYGDIELTDEGEFIRVCKDNREGMYSPVTQNQRHLNILRNLLIEEELLNNVPINSLIVVANPKTVLYKDKAPLDISEQVIRLDQMIEWLSSYINSTNRINIPVSKLYEISDFLLKNNKERTSMPQKTYFPSNDTKKENSVNITNKISKDDLLRDKILEYREEISINTRVKPYCIFNDLVIDLIVKHKPKTILELSSIPGVNISDIYKDKIVEITKAII